MDKPYIIRVSSQKGGVGKTTLSVNIATALALMDYRVLLIDEDPTNPSVGFYLGLEDVNIGYKDVLLEKVDIKKAIIKHEATGMYVLPGVPYLKPYMPDEDQIKNLVDQVKKMENYDFIVSDTPPGFYIGEIGKIYNEAIIISTPDMSAITSCIRLAETYNKDNVPHSLVVNRVRNKRYELSIKEMEDSYGAAAAAVLPEDDIVPRSVAVHVPAYLMDPHAPFSMKIGMLARSYVAKSGQPVRQVEDIAMASQRAPAGGKVGLSYIINWIRDILGF